MNRMSKISLIICVGLVLPVSTVVGEESEATKLLKVRNAEFKQDVIKVTDAVYTAVGYSVSPVSMIVGEDGIIIVDTGIDAVSAEKVLADFRKITEKPVRAIIFTHGHGDHTGGATVFIGNDNPQIWARSNFGSEGLLMRQAGLTIHNIRGARQGGFKLPPEKRINNGVAQAYWPQQGGRVFQATEKVVPTHLLGTSQEAYCRGGANGTCRCQR